ncbi:allophanate hydrolase subunit 1 [Phycicoccus sp. MQZ13P-5]|uniref:Allophanate hydrolase subunit 1 n=2 Tax=Phycicoccus sonneratiae TaxID=2807628 RepID=A0ABS2CIC7_9MICO|nr:allophanate hydrolase subunit 1 [Phycicoccus sonneraticus]
MGGHAVLVEVADLAAVLVLEAALRPRVLTGEGVWARVTDVVPAARTVLLTTDGSDPADPAALGEAVRGVAASLDGSAPPPSEGEVVTVPVRYDGEDLDEVADRTGLSVAEVVAAHTGTGWRVAFGGFAPGFAYLVGGDPRLRVPRRSSPRASVPAGSVGLAGEFSGVYPRSSPGGWQLLGRTDVVLWDERRDPPALLRPGSVVRFVDAGGSG